MLNNEGMRTAESDILFEFIRIQITVLSGQFLENNIIVFCHA
jgi:hypothetical protein